MPPPTPKTTATKQQSATSLFWWLWRDYLRPQKLLLAGAVVLMMIEGSMLALISRLIQPMFDDVFAAGDRNALFFVGFAIMAIFFVRAGTSAGQRILMSLIKQLTAAAMRRHLLRHLMTLDSGFFQIHPPGQLIERVQGDVNVINSVWSSILTALARDLISLMGLLAVAIWIDWKWTLIAVVGIPLLILPSLLVQAYIRRRARNSREIAGNISTRLDEVFHGINPIKLNALEAYQAKRYDTLIKKSVDAEVRTAVGQAAVPALIDIMTGIGFLGVMLYGGSEIISGEKTNGEFMAFFTAMALAFDPLRRLGLMSGQWQMAAASVERLQYVLNLKPTILSPAQGKAAPLQAPKIILEDVHLNYGDLPVLRGVSFAAAAGKTTALVGASGAGKSTIFNVLTRLVEGEQGTAAIDGASIKTTTWPTCAVCSLWSHKTPPCLMKPCATTFFLAAKMSLMNSSKRSLMQPMSRISCPHFPMVWIAPLGRADLTFQAASASVSRSHVRFCAIRRSCCWTRRQVRSTPNQRRLFKPRWKNLPRAARRWLLHTACQLCAMRIQLSSWTKAVL